MARFDCGLHGQDTENRSRTTLRATRPRGPASLRSKGSRALGDSSRRFAGLGMTVRGAPSLVVIPSEPRVNAGASEESQGAHSF